MNPDGARPWVGRAVAAAVVAALVNVTLSVLGLTHDTVLITLLAAATVAAIALALEAVDASTHLPWTTPRGDARPGSGEDTRTSMFRHMVEVHQVSHDADDTICWQLADLASLRLRQVHGLRYADDPARATELLGPLLADWVSRDRRHRYVPDAPHLRYSTAVLGEVLTRIEEL